MQPAVAAVAHPYTRQMPYFGPIHVWFTSSNVCVFACNHDLLPPPLSVLIGIFIWCFGQQKGFYSSQFDCQERCRKHRRTTVLQCTLPQVEECRTLLRCCVVLVHVHLHYNHCFRNWCNGEDKKTECICFFLFCKNVLHSLHSHSGCVLRSVKIPSNTGIPYFFWCTCCGSRQTGSDLITPQNAPLATRRTLWNMLTISPSWTYRNVLLKCLPVL